MKPLLVFIMYLLWLRGHRCAPTKEEDIHFVENLKILSEVGEKYVDEDVKKALTGIKQMKIMMERNEVKYMDLMKTLKKSSEEKEMQKEFDQSFQIYFMSDPDLTEPYFLPAFPEESVRNTGSPKDWEAPGFLQLVFDFSRTVLEGVGEVITEVFEGYRETASDMAEQLKDSDRSGMFSKSTPGHERTCNMLHQNSSGCPHFHERCQKCQDNFMQVCPSVPELHIKCDDAFKLVNISGEMYQQILQIVKCHTEDTSYVLNKMKERFGWVSELSNMIIGPENIFNIVKVSSSAKGGDASSLNETVVDVNILTSPTFTIKVPQDLDTESSEFIEYVAGKALQFYKKNF